MGCIRKNLIVGVVVVVVAAALIFGSLRAEAQVHHVVGDDPGWDLASDIASWAADRSFVVGDFLWFAYSSGLNKDNIVELKSKDEFESCDVSNPIKLYDNGIDKIFLEREGFRYFASANPETCKKGLKLPVEIKSKSTVASRSSSSWKAAMAEEPTAPSSSIKIYGSTLAIIAVTILYHMGI